MINLSSVKESNTILPLEVTTDEIALIKQIRKSVNEGHDIEIRKAPDGRLKVLEVRKRNITIG